MTASLTSAANPVAEAFSPSFGNGDGATSAAFELKFLLDEADGLRADCRISSRRTAFIGDDCGPVRLTLDRHAACVPQLSWRVDALGDGLPLLPGQVVLELKYRDALPALFKRLLVEMCLNPGSV